jgi:hypothetical protein
MADTRTGGLPKLGERLNKVAAEHGATRLTCQWCSVSLPPGETICATCGSAGIPDTSMIVPDIVEAPVAPSIDVNPQGEQELVEWWKDVDEVNTYTNSDDEPHDPLPMIIGLVGTGVICILLGVLVAPSVLASAFESSLGVTVDSTSDLRPLGGVLGLLLAAFIGAIAVFVTAPRR